jgi:hypothetical protein
LVRANFRLTKIDAIKGPRVYLADEAPYGGSAFYLKSGKNCRRPTGQAHLVIPTQPILDVAAANPNGKQIGGSLPIFRTARGLGLIDPNPQERQRWQNAKNRWPSAVGNLAGGATGSDG